MVEQVQKRVQVRDRVSGTVSTVKVQFVFEISSTVRHAPSIMIDCDISKSSRTCLAWMISVSPSYESTVPISSIIPENIYSFCLRHVG